VKKISVLATAAFLIVPAAHGRAQAINDAQIAAIVVTANQVDIDAGELARSSSTNADVRKFAERMVIDHTGVNKSATDLAGKLNVTPQDSDTSRALKSGGEQNVAKLSALKGRAFDAAYVDHEVVYHARVLEAIDETLIPNAQNAELKALIVKVRPAIAAHLEHAKHLQAQLSGRK
jgi:putative membrane protein